MNKAIRYMRSEVKSIHHVVRHRIRRTTLAPERFVIFGRGRSGTTALVSLLNAVKGIHCAGEILHDPVFNARAHVHARCANSRSEVYGCKILSYHIRHVQRLRDPTGFLNRLWEDGFKVIYLKRENVVQQAVSLIRARAFGFHSTQATVPQKLEIEPSDLLNRIEKSERLDAFEAECLNGVPHLPLTYETHLADESFHHQILVRVCEFLGVPHRPEGDVRTALRKISPWALSDSVSNFGEIKAVLETTPYARFLG